VATVHVKTGTLAAGVGISGGSAVVSLPALSHDRRLYPPVVISHPRDNTTEPVRIDPSMLRWFLSPEGGRLAAWLAVGLALLMYVDR
jgi:hypothetical protein